MSYSLINLNFGKWWESYNRWIWTCLMWAYVLSEQPNDKGTNDSRYSTGCRCYSKDFTRISEEKFTNIFLKWSSICLLWSVYISILSHFQFFLFHKPIEIYNNVVLLQISIDFVKTILIIHLPVNDALLCEWFYNVASVHLKHDRFLRFIGANIYL